ncbi:pectinesterase inhibitor 3 [Populus alba x Populus x berolinensis]|uniref:Pectinesterase inhibitor 3 n=1 Tax=Populus alba x Populus x berolinensis TaxID=444605 RepID=A0AAD6QNB0_9ROSI|nr:pectinesterase inhibitor 3 [Populus alba x Populus x berolinensis]
MVHLLRCIAQSSWTKLTLYPSLQEKLRKNNERDTFHYVVHRPTDYTRERIEGPANTPRDLAQAAVKVSIARARKVSNYLSTLSGLKKKRERVALSDCVEQIYDSVDELSKTLRELKHLREETFRWQMSNAQTWVSAALTNEDTCLDGFHEVESKAKDDVKRKITNVARVTSNALYMINRLDESRGRPKLGH